MNLSIQTRELGGRGEACEFGASPQAGKQGVMRLLFHISKQIQIHKRLTGDRPLIGVRKARVTLACGSQLILQEPLKKNSGYMDVPP